MTARWSDFPGVELVIQEVSSFTLARAVRGIKPPKVPMYVSPVTKKLEENPNDPTYAEKVQAYDLERSMLTLDILLAGGVVEVVSAGAARPIETEEWSNELAQLGIEVPMEGVGRRTDWIKLELLKSNDRAILSLITAIRELSGRADEKDVDEAVDSFRSTS